MAVREVVEAVLAIAVVALLPLGLWFSWKEQDWIQRAAQPVSMHPCVISPIASAMRSASRSAEMPAGRCTP